MCFISTIPVRFIYSTDKVSKYYFAFIFHIILLSFKEIPHSQLFPGLIPWRDINTESSVIRGGISFVVFDYWYQFYIKYWSLLFGLFKTQVLELASRGFWSHQHWHLSCSKHWNIKENFFFNSGSHVPFQWRLKSFKMFKRNIALYERKKEIATKTWTLHEMIVHNKKKEKGHIMNF